MLYEIKQFALRMFSFDALMIVVFVFIIAQNWIGVGVAPICYFALMFLSVWLDEKMFRGLYEKYHGAIAIETTTVYSPTDLKDHIIIIKKITVMPELSPEDMDLVITYMKKYIGDNPKDETIKLLLNNQFKVLDIEVFDCFTIPEFPNRFDHMYALIENGNEIVVRPDSMIRLPQEGVKIKMSEGFCDFLFICPFTPARALMYIYNTPNYAFRIKKEVNSEVIIKEMDNLTNAKLLEFMEKDKNSTNTINQARSDLLFVRKEKLHSEKYTEKVLTAWEEHPDKVLGRGKIEINKSLAILSLIGAIGFMIIIIPFIQFLLVKK